MKLLFAMITNNVSMVLLQNNDIKTKFPWNENQSTQYLYLLIMNGFTGPHKRIKIYAGGVSKLF